MLKPGPREAESARRERSSVFPGPEALLEAPLHGGPLAVEDGEVHRVALEALDVHVAAQGAFAHRAQPLDGLLRAQIPGVGLERHAHAAEPLEAVLEEEQLGLRVGGRSPVLPGEEGGADFHLPLGRSHVEAPRGPDGLARLVPDLGEDDGLPSRHEVPGLADQGQGLIEAPGRSPDQVAAHLLILHGLEEAGGVALLQGLERQMTTPEGGRREVHAQPPRSRAAWSTAITVIESLISPRATICSTSLNAKARRSMNSVRSGGREAGRSSSARWRWAPAGRTLLE